MIKQWKKMIAIFTMVAIMWVSAAGCKSSNKPSDAESSSAGANTTETSTTNTGSGDNSQSETDKTSALLEALKGIEVEENREPKRDSYDFGGYEVVIASAWSHELFLEPGFSEKGDQWLERVKEVEKKFNVKIKPLAVEHGLFCDQLMTAAQAGSKFADIIELDSRWLTLLAYPGYLQPLNKLKTGVYVKDEKWNPLQVRMGVLNKNVYAIDKIPPEIKNVIFWNKTLFEEQGLPNLYDLVWSNQWTWEKFKEIAVSATKDLDNDGQVDQWGIGGPEFERPLIWSNGGRILEETDDGKVKFTMNSPATIEALDFLVDLYEKSKCYERQDIAADWRYACDPQFINRAYAMLNWPFYGAEVWFKNMEDDWGIVPTPMGPRMKDYVCSAEFNRYWALPSSNNDIDKASIVMDALFAPYPDEAPDSWEEKYTSVFRDEDSMKVVKYLLEENRLQLDITGYFPNLGTSSPVVGWYMNPNGNIFNSIWSGQKTPSVAVNEKVEMANAAINDFFSNIGNAPKK